jgi:transcription antitermination factor NusG
MAGSNGTTDTGGSFSVPPVPNASGYWACAQTEPRREMTVIEYLANEGIGAYVPLMRERERVVPLFPTYLFVHIIDRWHVVKNTIGVVRVLLAGEHPARVPEKIIMEIQEREGRDGVVKLPKPCKRGDRVRIVKGTFRDHLAVYDGMTAKQRERVLLEFMGRAVALELGTGDIAAV